MKNVAFVLALVLFSSMAMAQKVNYSGEWKLNESKSELGYEFSLAPASVTIEHTKKTLDIVQVNEWDGQEYESKLHYTLDGKECKNIGFGESETTSTAEVVKESNAIKIVTKGSAEGMSYTMTQNIMLKDGQLIISMDASSDMGDMFEKYVFDKQ